MSYINASTIISIIVNIYWNSTIIISINFHELFKYFQHFFAFLSIVIVTIAVLPSIVKFFSQASLCGCVNLLLWLYASASFGNCSTLSLFNGNVFSLHFYYYIILLSLLSFFNIIIIIIIYFFLLAVLITSWMQLASSFCYSTHFQ